MKKQNALKSLTTTSLDQILEDLDIVVVNGGGRQISCQCPFHPDNHPSFSMNSPTGLWICYQCGRSGNLGMLMEALGAGDVNPEEAVHKIKRSRFHPPKMQPEHLIELTETVNKFKEDPYYLYAKYSSFGDVPGWALAERYISTEAAAKYGLRWNKGWIIPIWSPRQVQDVTEDFWGWQFKRLDHVDNYPPGLKKSRTLFGLTHVEREAVLVESPLDVVRMASVGIPAVASYGAMVSAYQISLIEAKLDRLILALDADEAGREQSQKIYPMLYRRLPTIRPVFPEGVKDPGDMTDKQLLEVFA